VEAALDAALAECAAHGLTAVHEAGATTAMLALYKARIDAGRFPLRNFAMVTCADRNTFCPLPRLDAYGRGRLSARKYAARALRAVCVRRSLTRGRSVKLFLDGALGSWGAAMLAPYSDAPAKTGLLRVTPAQLAPVVQAWIDAGFQVSMHAIGDRANRLALDTYNATVQRLGLPDVRSLAYSNTHTQRERCQYRHVHAEVQKHTYTHTHARAHARMRPLVDGGTGVGRHGRCGCE
jgi:predicted amidohydrolase YtcJ